MIPWGFASIHGLLRNSFNLVSYDPVRCDFQCPRARSQHD